MLGIKPGDSGVVILYHVDEYICTQLAEHFIAQSQFCYGCMDKESTLTHFPLKPGYEELSFLDQAVEEFEYGLVSIIMDYIDTPELGASFDETETVPSSLSYTFLCSFSTIYDTFRTQLAPSIKSCKLCCQTRDLLLPVLYTD